MSDETKPSVADNLGVTEAQLDAHHHATTAMVLVDYLREVGAEFNAQRTALETDTFIERVEQAEHMRLLKLGAIRGELYAPFLSSLRRTLPGKIGANFGLTGEYLTPYLLVGMSRYDHQRITDAVLALSDRDAGLLAAEAIAPVPDRYRFLPSKEVEPGLYNSAGQPDWPKFRGIVEEISQKLADIVKENVMITMEPGRTVQYTTGVMAGNKKNTRTLSGDIPGAESVAFTETAIAEEGLRIRRISAEDAAAGLKHLWFTVKNGLTGRKLIFKQFGTSYVVNIRPGSTNMVSFTGHHLKSGDFKVTVEKVEAE